jgi:uncharacterized protein (TIGR03083 family)
MPDLGTPYIEIRDRVIEAVSTPGLDLDVGAPACPGWTARDVLAHHIGLISDIAHDHLELMEPFIGRLDEQWRDPDVMAARDLMTGSQVAERRGVDLPILVEEWRAATDAVLPVMRGEVPGPETLPPTIPFILICDLVVHETDIRSALGLPRAERSAAQAIALAAYASTVEQRIGELGLGPLTLAYDGRERVLGDGPSSTTLHSDRHELVRVLAGRRTGDQIRALTWDGDPEPYLGVLSAYGLPTVPSHD